MKPSSVILKYCFVSEILPTRCVVYERTRQVLHRVRANLNVPGWWASDFRVLLAKKLPMFLSRLNEIICGCVNILLLSGSF